MIYLSKEKLAKELITSRKSKNLTQEQLSKATDINRVMIGKIERQEYIPSIVQLESLANVLGIDISKLFVKATPKQDEEIFTAFRGSNLTEHEKDGINHFLKMMKAAKRQILLREAIA